VLVYSSGIDLSSSTLRYLSRPLAARHLERGTRWRRLSADRQALRLLAHLRCGHIYARLAAGFGAGIATFYRYVAEGVKVLAAVAPDLAAATRTAAREGAVILDGTLLPIDRIAADRPYCSDKHKKHGGTKSTAWTRRCPARQSRAARTDSDAPGEVAGSNRVDTT
jgi:hypothetical protein